MPDRTEDMGTERRLKVTRDGDGDVIISIVTGRGLPLHDRSLNLAATVEFCRPGAGVSPRTHAALLDLIAAMTEDERARPDPHRPADVIGQ